MPRIPRIVRTLIPLLALIAGSLAAAWPRQQPASWTVDPRPIVTLGADEADGGAMLETVVYATRLPSGAILVGDRGDFVLKQFTPDGKLQKSFARKGGGPGEVRFLGKMFRCGDSVYTYDIEEGHRMSVFTLDGRYVRAFRFRVPAGQQVPYQSACNAGGRFVHIGWENFRQDAKGGVYRAKVPVWLSRADSSAPVIVDSVPGSERWGLVRDGQLRGAGPLPLGKQPVLAMGRTRAYVGTADRFEILSYDANGRPGARLQRDEPSVPVTRDDIRAEIDRAVGGAEARREAIERSYAEMTLPSTLPPYTALLVDADDHVWVRSYPRGTGAVRWSVFSPAGRLVAEVAVPRHLEVYEIGRDYLLGRYLDPEEEIPQVRQYRLTRR